VTSQKNPRHSPRRIEWALSDRQIRWGDSVKDQMVQIGVSGDGQLATIVSGEVISGTTQQAVSALRFAFTGISFPQRRL
jgi:hypothetical protein